jgi:hypothetical protein
MIVDRRRKRDSARSDASTYDVWKVWVIPGVPIGAYWDPVAVLALIHIQYLSQICRGSAFYVDPHASIARLRARYRSERLESGPLLHHIQPTFTPFQNAIRSRMFSAFALGSE